jgi:hypothetical protein
MFLVSTDIISVKHIKHNSGFSRLVVCNSCPTVLKDRVSSQLALRARKAKLCCAFFACLKAKLNAPRLSFLYAGVSQEVPHGNSSKKTTDTDAQTDSATVSTRDTGTQTEFDVIYITDLARYFHDIADKLGAGASLYSMQVRMLNC